MKTPRLPAPEACLPRGPADLAPRRRLLLGSAAASLLGGLMGSVNLGLALGLAGCGGGGGVDDAGAAPAAVDDPQRLPLGGVDSGGTGAALAIFVSAPIDSTAPITVNGLPFDTTDSAISDGDGQPLAPQFLQPGMTCQIEAEAPRGYNAAAPLARARTLRVSEQLRGPVAAVDAATSSFTALGQRVVVTPGTRFDAALAGGLAALQPGLLLQVWGQLDTSGRRIVATRLALAPATGAWVLRGVLRLLDRNSGRLAIGALQAVAQGGQLPQIADDVAVGGVVRARLAPGLIGGNAVLLAVRADALHLPDRVEAELEGRVTRFESLRRFAVDGVEVDASAATLGAGSNLLALGARAVVHGVSARGVLLASTVRVEPDEPVELEGTISAADTPRRSFVLRGITVVWSASTVFEGGSARLLAARRRVAVVGRWNADRSRLEALHIHVEA